MALRLDVSDMFDAWEKDFQGLISSARQRAATLEAAPIGETQVEEKEPIVILYKQDLADAEKCVWDIQLRQMEIEVSMLPQGARGTLQANLRRNKEVHDTYKKLLRQEESALRDRRNKSSLFKDKSSSADPRRSLLKAHELAADQSMRIERSRQSAMESETVAIATMTTLKGQRDQILRSTKAAGEIGDDLSKSNRILTTMTRQTLTNKLIMLGVIGLLVLSIIIVIYYKVVHRSTAALPS